MKNDVYACPVGHIRVMENRLFGRAAVERMLEAQDEEAVLSVLCEYGYELDTEQSCEELFARAEVQPCFQVMEFAPEPELFYVFLYKNDSYNAKVLLKNEIMKRETPAHILSPYGTVEIKKMQKAFTNRDFRACPPAMAAVLTGITACLSGFEEVREIELALDRAYYEDCYLLADHAKVREAGGFVRSYMELNADLSNIRTALRLNAMKIEKKGSWFMPGTLTGDFLTKIQQSDDADIYAALAQAGYERVLENSDGVFCWSAIEKNCDDILLDFVRERRANAFGIEPLFGYILARQREIMIARMIVLGRRNGLPTETIRARIRQLSFVK